MGTQILREVSWLFTPVFFMFAFFVLLRGHHEPGGGFIAGLIVGCGLAFGAVMRSSKEPMLISNRGAQRLLAVGLIMAFISPLIPLFSGKSFFYGQWVKISLMGEDVIKVGTPILFDLGVFAVVIAISSIFINGFIVASEEEQ